MTFDNPGSDATIALAGGTHIVNAPVVLGDNLVVTGSGTLEFSNSSSIAETGGQRSLNMSGAGGILILSGTDTYSGGTIVTAGTLALTSAAALPEATSLTIGAGGTLVFDPLAVVSGQQSAAQVVSAVPEPGALAMLISGVAGALIATQRAKLTTIQPLRREAGLSREI